MSKFSRLRQGNRSSLWVHLWFQDITDLNFPVLTCTPFIPQCWAPPTSLTRSSPIISTCKRGGQRINKREMWISFISLQVPVVIPCGSSFLAVHQQHLADPFHAALPSLNDSFFNLSDDLHWPPGTCHASVAPGCACLHASKVLMTLSNQISWSRGTSVAV